MASVRDPDHAEAHERDTFPAMLGKTVRDGHVDVGRVLRWLTRPDGREELLGTGEAHAAAVAVMSYLESHDPELVRLVRFDLPPHGLASATLGRVWHGLDRTLGADGTLEAALEASPWLGAVVADAWLADPDGVREAVRLGRAGEIPARHLARIGVLPARLIRALDDLVDALPTMSHARCALVSSQPPSPADVAAGWDEGLWRCMPVEAVRRLAPLPASWVPRGAAEWRAFVLLCPVLDRFGVGDGGPDAWTKLLGCKGRWEEWADRLARMSGRNANQACSDLSDVARAYVDQVLVPAISAKGHAVTIDALHGLRHAAMALLCSGRNVAAITRTIEEWHGRERRMTADLAALDWDRPDPLAWRPGLPDARHGDVRVVVLTGVAQLLAEGAKGTEDGMAGLSHCVGGYAPVCRSTGERILSLRSVRADGTVVRLSTAHVSWAGALRVLQHRGRGNDDPPPEAVAALRLYASSLDRGTTDVDEGALAPLPDDPLDRCGFDARDATSRARARDMWRRFVPGPVAALDEADLARLATELSGKRWTWRPEPYGPRPSTHDPANGCQGAPVDPVVVAVRQDVA